MNGKKEKPIELKFLSIVSGGWTYEKVCIPVLETTHTTHIHEKHTQIHTLFVIQDIWRRLLIKGLNENKNWRKPLHIYLFFLFC